MKKKTTQTLLILGPLLSLCFMKNAMAEDPRTPTTHSLDEEQVEALAKLALAGIQREFPNKTAHVITSETDKLLPRQLHPVFYGCFDWHSSVHGHWMLVRLLKQYPNAPIAKKIRSTLNNQFAKNGLRKEADYLRSHKGFERMYGWAWALRLATELHDWADSDATRWAEYYRPVAEAIVNHAKDYLPLLEWPVRCGFHPESAFPLAQMLDYARKTSHTELEALIVKKAMEFYGEDRNYPVAYEPSGNDFFSAGLNEADLMRRVLPKDKYQTWLTSFFPSLSENRLGNLLTPAKVSDVTDGHLVHLAGLNFNRAWTMDGIASVLDSSDPRRAVLLKAVHDHTAAGMEYVFSGHYQGEHWLASFAVYLLTDTGE